VTEYDLSQCIMPRLPYTKLAPKGYEALIGVGHYINTQTALEPVLLGLVYLRASILNWCGFCIGMHTAELKHHNEPQTRIDAVADWVGSDAFTPRERAALAWTDAITNIQISKASDEDYAAVKQFFDGKDLADLTFAIAQINAWNRLGIAFAMEWDPPKHEPAAAETSAVDDDGGKVAED
jgi:AhpD family alkylhydroperoxidase